VGPPGTSRYCTLEDGEPQVVQPFAPVATIWPVGYKPRHPFHGLGGSAFGTPTRFLILAPETLQTKRTRSTPLFFFYSALVVPDFFLLLFPS